MNVEKLVEANALASNISLLQKYIDQLDKVIDPKVLDHTDSSGIAVIIQGTYHLLPLDEAAKVRIAKQCRGNLVKHLRRVIKKLKAI